MGALATADASPPSSRPFSKSSKARDLIRPTAQPKVQVNCSVVAPTPVLSVTYTLASLPSHPAIASHHRRCRHRYHRRHHCGHQHQGAMQ